jgi:hypothetical protein
VGSAKSAARATQAGPLIAIFDGNSEIQTADAFGILQTSPISDVERLPKGEHPFRGRWWLREPFSVLLFTAFRNSERSSQRLKKNFNSVLTSHLSLYKGKHLVRQGGRNLRPSRFSVEAARNRSLCSPIVIDCCCGHAFFNLTRVGEHNCGSILDSVSPVLLQRAVGKGCTEQLRRLNSEWRVPSSGSRPSR